MEKMTLGTYFFWGKNLYSLDYIQHAKRVCFDWSYSIDFLFQQRGFC